MPGGPHIYHIANQRVIPNKMYGVNILKGVEANIINEEGNIDIPEYILKKLDIVVASLHEVCIDVGDRAYNTRTLTKAMENNYIDVIAHPGNPVFPIDIQEVVQKAKETNTLIEINNSSFVSSRIGSLENCIEIAKACKEQKVKIVVGSDAHIAFDVGRFDKVMEILREVNMPEELIMNLSAERFIEHLASKGKERFRERLDKPVI